MRNGTLRIGTWNIAANRDLHSVIHQIAKYGIDICVLQEVVTDAEDVNWPPLLGVETNRTIYKSYFSPALASPNKFFRPSRQYGLATLVLSDIECASLRTCMLAADTVGCVRTAETEQRILQISHLLTNPPILLANTHLAHTKDWSNSSFRAAQAADIALFLSTGHPNNRVILCGDFNISPNSEDLTPIRSVLPVQYVPDKPTYPTPLPGRVIDYFFSKEPLNAFVEVHSMPQLSDHNLVILQIENLPCV